MSANPVQKAQKSMSAKVCMSQMTLSSYSLFQLSVPTVLNPQLEAMKLLRKRLYEANEAHYNRT